MLTIVTTPVDLSAPSTAWRPPLSARRSRAEAPRSPTASIRIRSPERRGGPVDFPRPVHRTPALARRILPRPSRMRWPASPAFFVLPDARRLPQSGLPDHLGVRPACPAPARALWPPASPTPLERRLGMISRRQRR
ncbi:hypothetical protein ACRAWD_21350 [Caulobacter segnis]